MGKCAHCNRKWYTKHDGKELEPRRIPTCPEAEIMVVCTDCFDALPAEKIISLALAQEKAGRVHDNAPSFNPMMGVTPMTSTEYALVESDIADWVRYMKGETAAPPFDQEALVLS